jgi:hypothetical protein
MNDDLAAAEAQALFEFPSVFVDACLLRSLAATLRP